MATVWAIGDRADDVVYEEAQKRVSTLAETQPHAASLAAVMFQLGEAQRSAKRAKRRKK